jgi:Holliday junction resolvase RusA-like endonuclease
VTLEAAPPPVTSFSLVIDGQPKGQPRPRFTSNGHPYADKKQRLAEGEIRRAWENEGSPRLPDGPLRLSLHLAVARPASHFKRDGSLSAAGEREPWPMRSKPDLDNAIKLVLDALGTLAFRDDVRFVDVHATREWSTWPSSLIVVSLVT